MLMTDGHRLGIERGILAGRTCEHICTLYVQSVADPSFHLWQLLMAFKSLNWHCVIDQCFLPGILPRLMEF